MLSLAKEFPRSDSDPVDRIPFFMRWIISLSFSLLYIRLEYICMIPSLLSALIKLSSSASSSLLFISIFLSWKCSFELARGQILFSSGSVQRKTLLLLMDGRVCLTPKEESDVSLGSQQSAHYQPQHHYHHIQSSCVFLEWIHHLHCHLDRLNLCRDQLSLSSSRAGQCLAALASCVVLRISRPFAASLLARLCRSQCRASRPTLTHFL